MKVDFHVHTKVSLDSTISFEHIKSIFKEEKVDKIAVTDHNEIKGAIALNKLYGDKVIVGEEVSSSAGHIIGLFVNELIPKELSAMETAKRIKEQGGLVYLPHIFDEWRHGIGEKEAEKIIELVDIIEVYNARASKKANEKSEKFAKKYKKMKTSSSDAHYKRNVGISHTILKDFNSSKELMSSLKSARFECKQSPFTVFSPMLTKFFRKIFE